MAEKILRGAAEVILVVVMGTPLCKNIITFEIHYSTHHSSLGKYLRLKCVIPVKKTPKIEQSNWNNETKTQYK